MEFLMRYEMSWFLIVARPINASIICSFFSLYPNLEFLLCNFAFTIQTSKIEEFSDRHATFRYHLRHWFFTIFCGIIYTTSCKNTCVQCLKITENVAFEFWHFPPIFVLLKLTCLVTLFDSKCKRSSLRSQCWMRLFL